MMYVKMFYRKAQAPLTFSREYPKVHLWRVNRSASKVTPQFYCFRHDVVWVSSLFYDLIIEGHEISCFFGERTYTKKLKKVFKLKGTNS